MTRQFTQREFEKILKRNGFDYIRTHGSHNIWKRDMDEIAIQKKPNMMCCRRLIKEYALAI